MSTGPLKWTFEPLNPRRQTVNFFAGRTKNGGNSLSLLKVSLNVLVPVKWPQCVCSAAFGCSGLCSVCSEGRKTIGTARRSYLACPWTESWWDGWPLQWLLPTVLWTVTLWWSALLDGQLSVFFLCVLNMPWWCSEDDKIIMYLDLWEGRIEYDWLSGRLWLWKELFLR